MLVLADVYNRLAILHGTSLLMGCTMGPLISTIAFFNPSVIITAALGTSAVFVCFSGAALFAKRRHYMYLGGILSSCISLLFTFRFLNFITMGSFSSGLYEVELFGGLLIFIGYVVFDTQMIIEDASAGRKDFVRHALDLLLDFVAVFVRLLVILARNSEKKERKNRS
mmetsp:Transcript_70299/g.187306  ORF Transcript_70299/g.187306 Transcript_70299/m.187306 type:complete len:168 (-) Transcript_70299:73-576(-)